jgi:hypothetical protein
MPNHITNIIKIIGDSKTVAEVIESIKGEERAIDFNKICIMPEELKNTISPSRIVSEEEYEKAFLIQAEKLANGTYNDMFDSGLPITSKMSVDYYKRFGCDNWNDWSRNAWGTKWNAYDIEVISENEIKFDTAWSTPLPVFETLSKRFPTLEIHVRYADEDTGHNVGEFTLKDGVMINSNIPNGGSIEAYEMALEIKDDTEYYLHDILVDDLGEDEIDDNFYSKLINLVHKKGILYNDYPSYLLEKLKEMALVDEQYERVGEIQKLLNELAL